MSVDKHLIGSSWQSELFQLRDKQLAESVHSMKIFYRFTSSFANHSSLWPSFTHNQLGSDKLKDLATKAQEKLLNIELHITMC